VRNQPQRVKKKKKQEKRKRKEDRNNAHGAEMQLFLVALINSSWRSCYKSELFAEFRLSFAKRNHREKV
jgi:hypothetical protein